ncbi:unnamed protein product [Porites lobata]|uniref:Uncharacterized protein n=1 Tax=Porites lobata TaxID=104759 RepID=A0ABN8NTR9_9CNID|nr:unnamed protein product [Porites lobata]
MKFSVPTLIFIVTRLLDGNNFSHFPSIRKGVMRKRPINKMELVFPLLFRSSDRTCSISANLISRLTSWRKKRYAFQCSLSPDLIALLCQASRVFISCLISGEINGLGFDFILIRLIGA